MKPLRLEMSAFGPFAGTEVIDFRALDGQPLLLIHGETGAGKTTLIDAMCFALYGQTSGEERSGSDMRCQVAPADLLTHVAFEFALGDALWRVRREPTQERPKARGEGTTTHGHTATLWRTGSPDRVAAEGVAAVGTKVGELLGFTVSQFRQVVVLPQGRFRELLTADSSTREGILEALFQTGLYERITRRLKDQRLAARRAYDQLVTESGGQLSGQGFESPEALEAAIAEAGQALATVRDQLPAAQAARDRAQKAQEAGEQVLARRKTLETARASIAALEARQAEIDALTSRVEAARKAAPLLQQRRSGDRRPTERDAARAGAPTAANALEAATARAGRAAQALQATQAQEPDREAARKELDRLEALAGDAQALEQARGALNAAQRAVDAAAERVSTQVTAREAATEGLVTAEPKRDRLRVLAAEADGRQRAQDEADARVRTARDRRTAVTARARARSQVAAAAADVAALRATWDAGQAARLAATLEEGAPCPVCGSAEHPSPAHTDATLPTEMDLQRADGELTDATRAAETARRTLGQHQATLAGADATLQALEAQLGAAAETPFDALREQATARAAQTEEALRAREALPAAENAVEDLRGAIDTAVIAVRQAEDAHRDAGIALAERREQVRSLEERVPEALRAAGALPAARDVAKARLDALKKAHDTAQTEDGAARTALATAVEAAARAKEAAAAAEGTLADERGALDAARAHAGLADDGAFARAADDAAGVDALAERVAGFAADRAAATARVEDAARAAKDDGPVDAEALARAAAGTREAVEGLAQQEGRSSARLGQLTALRDTYRRTLSRRDTAEREHQLIASVATVAEGGNPRSVSFQRFVLAALLDDVVHNASTRLHHMSQGRYALVRSDAVTRAGRAAGLDLAVEDSYSGQRRPAHTLSGGESFLAALALSLGLSDVVQGYSGGIRMDALFVDEGFGTLDPESLDRALDVLTGLNQGRRLIGIISHVQELQSRIPTRLRVRKTRTGSHTHLIVDGVAVAS